jgi:phage terminase small subunit
MAGIRDQYGLTPKQRKFAENLADGMTQSDAYKFAYDATEMQSDTIRNKASQLAQRGDIRAAVDALMGERMRLMEVKGVSDRSKVVGLLRQFAEDEARPDHVRLRAVELWGKTCGAFIEVIEDRRDRPAAAVAVELERRLGALLSAAAPQVTVIDMLPERVNGADDDDGSGDDGSGDSDDAGSGDDEARDAHAV